MRRAKLVSQGVAVGLVASLLGLLVWKVVSDEKPDVQRGAVAPDFTLERLGADGSVRLSSLRGKVVVVNFWASWCTPCKKEMPLLEETWQRYRGRGVEFIGVNTTDFSGDAQRFVKRYNVTFPVVRDSNGRVLARFGGLPLPWTYFIDSKGQIASYLRGEVREEELERGIQAALGA